MQREKPKMPILAPLYIVKEEKLYILWVLTVIFFGLINIWAGLLMGDKDAVINAFKEGIVYTYLISICAPFIAETLLSILVELKSKEKIEFITYKVLSSGFNLLLIFCLSYVWVGRFKGIIWLQIVLGIVVSAFGFYMFCIGRMGSHKSLVGEYANDKYLNEEKESMKKLQEAASEVQYIADEEGEIEV